MSADEGRKLMQSALDQWLGLERLVDIARDVLPAAECVAIDSAAKLGAARTLDYLNERKGAKTPAPPPNRALVVEDDREEITEILNLRKVLNHIA